MIDKLTLKNFTVFEDMTIDFSSKINVIIGKNGTGKSHLLKAAYALCAASKNFKKVAVAFDSHIQDAVTDNLLGCFLPLDGKLGKLRRQGAEEHAELSGDFVFDKGITLNFHSNSQSVAIQRNSAFGTYSWEPVFIPTKEVLSFMKGFNSLYEKYELSFDQTYRDICLLLDLPERKPGSLSEKAKWAMKEIEQVCGGRFIFYGGGKVTFRTTETEFSANAAAEGFRKAGMLSRLLETGAIQPGASGPLFWDEPEANMNPKLMKLFVQIMLELARNGQQIIIATHDYVILKWFDLLAGPKPADGIRYHSLYRAFTSDPVKIESVDNFREFSQNAIADAYMDLTREQVKSNMGELGK